MKKILLITIMSMMMVSCGYVTEHLKEVLAGNKDKERLDSLQNALEQMEKKLEETKQNTQIPDATSSPQEIFTLVYAESDDGFVNIRQSPSAKANIVGQVLQFYHGLGNAVKIGQQGKWVKVRNGSVEGWCNGNYLGYQNWYSGHGSKVLIANKQNTPIYVESYEDGVPALFATVKQGTIIADDFTEYSSHYILSSAHDALYISKSDAIVRTK